jgi:hypothetical protein
MNREICPMNLDLWAHSLRSSRMEGPVEPDSIADRPMNARIDAIDRV